MNPGRSPVQAFLATPKGYLLPVLVLAALVGSLHATPLPGLVNIVAAVPAAVLVDLLFAFRQERRRIFPDGAILTGLIVALVLNTDLPWYFCAATAAVAVLSKHLLSVGRRPVFNPAAVGLALAILAFGSDQSWWGAFTFLPAWTIVLLIVAGVMVTNRVNRFPMVFGFLGVYFGLFLVLGLLHVAGAGDAFRPPFINAVLFLAFFMLTDPPTSPSRYQDQVLFGALAAVISAVGYLVLSGLAFLLVGLLVANCWNAWRVWTETRQRSAGRQVSDSAV